MKKLIFSLIVLISTNFQIFSQSLIDISKGTTCENAIEISTTEIFGPTTAPVSTKAADNNMFANTQNVVWYKFEAVEDGYLTFDIVPIDTLDNYDFVLYKGKDICKELENDSKTPLRSNFYRNDLQKQGMTGLSIFGNKKSYSECIEVKKGENFYLLLNNIYEGGAGHRIVFDYLKSYTVKGSIIDNETKQPINDGLVTWQNTRNTDETFTVFSNKKGEFDLKILLHTDNFSFPRYYFYAYSDAYFISDTTILSKEIPGIEADKFDFVLNKIKEGYNYSDIPNIYFEPNESDKVAGADKIMKKIFTLMTLNQNIMIRVEGHTNGFYPSTSVDETLSENRAKEIKQYFVDKGIDASRISIKGFGSTKLMYKTPEDETQEGFNRRVEFYILKY